MLTNSSRRQNRKVKGKQRPLPRPTGRSKAEVRKWVERAKALPDLRFDKVKAVREAIEAGIYDADTNLEELLARFAAELSGQFTDRE